METIFSEMICYFFWELPVSVGKNKKESSRWIETMIVSQLSRRKSDSNNHICYLLWLQLQYLVHAGDT